MSVQKSKNPTRGLTSHYEGAVYYRPRSILLLAPSLDIGPRDKTHNRKAIRLIIGCSRPVQVCFDNAERAEGRAVLVSDKAQLCNIRGLDSDVALVDVTAATPEYALLSEYLDDRLCLQLDPLLFAELLPRFIAGQDGSLSGAEVAGIIARAAHLVTGVKPMPLKYDPRIVRALELIEQLPLTEIGLARLARVVHLSPDRFRHLFKEVTGSTVSQYARQTAVWRALEIISRGATNTAASHLVGFHDASHFYRVYSDMFGVSLSEKSNPRKFRRIRCFN
ncbi:MAG: AraC family transcriptional regulator [Ketobacter sp.]|nr:MAG: AraC family transcriptional regulator [Ketobacter sp.]